MKRLHILLFSLAIVTAGCGSKGTYAPGVIDGDEAATRITDAVNEGTVACQIRRGRPPAITLAPLLKPSIIQWAGIDTGRGYRSNDIDSCAEYIKAGVTFDPVCGYLAWRCNLNPVNKITGGN